MHPSIYKQLGERLKDGLVGGLAVLPENWYWIFSTHIVAQTVMPVLGDDTFWYFRTLHTCFTWTYVEAKPPYIQYRIIKTLKELHKYVMISI